MGSRAVEVTTNIGCSNNCVYCPQAKLIKAYAARSCVTRMSFDAFKRYLARIPRSFELHFSGLSEPFLNPDCTGMILHAAGEGYRIMVSTTLVGLQLPDVELLERVPFTHFNVHLPSLGAAERIRVDEAYLHILERITKTGWNLVFRVQGSATYEAITSRVAAIQYLKSHSRAGNVRIAGKRRQERHPGAIRCLRKLRQNVVLPNGDVVLCCMDYGLKHVLGSLETDELPALHRGEEFARVARGLRRPAVEILCRYCAFASVADGIAARAILRMKSLVGALRPNSH